MAAKQPSLNELAAQVAELTKNFTAYLEKNKIPEPTLEPDSPTSYTGLDGESFVLRQKLLDTISDLSILVSGPSESIFNYVHNVSLRCPTLLRLRLRVKRVDTDN